jgi:hypothetical protein
METFEVPYLSIAITNNGDHSKTYFRPYPEEQRPTLIKDLGLMIFLTEDAMRREIKKFGTAKNLIMTYLTDDIGKMVGVGRTIINLSTSDYWITEADKVVKIPKCDEIWRNEYLVANNLKEQDTGDKDLLVIYTYSGGNIQEGKLNITEYKNRWVKRLPMSFGHPIMLDDYNLLIFNSQESANSFINEYDGKLSNYTETMASSSVEEQHEEEKDQLRLGYKQDKLAIAKTASLMCGSAVIGAAVKFGLNKIFGPPAESKILSRLAFAATKRIGRYITSHSPSALMSLSPLNIIPVAGPIIAGVVTLLNATTLFSDQDNLLGTIGRGVKKAKSKIADCFNGIGSFIRWNIFGWI